MAMILVCAVVAAVALARAAAGCGPTGVTSSTTAQAESTTLSEATAGTDSAGTSTTKAKTSTTAKGASTTTGASGATTTSNANGATTTSAGPDGTDSSTETTVALSPALQQYKSDMSQWAAIFETLPEGDPTEITDVIDTSQVDVDAAVQFAAAVHGLLDQLKAIQPPAEIAATHQKLVDVIADLVAATDKAVDALKNKDQAAMDAVLADKAAIEDRAGPVFESLTPFLGV
jgi:hypothetical protein